MKNLIRKTLNVLYAMLAGVVITLVSGVVPTPHFGLIPIDVLEWGAPLPWITRVIPTKIRVIHWDNFVIDLLFWVIVCLIILGIILIIKRRRASKTMRILRLFRLR